MIRCEQIEGDLVAALGKAQLRAHLYTPQRNTINFPAIHTMRRAFGFLRAAHSESHKTRITTHTHTCTQAHVYGGRSRAGYVNMNL